MLKGLIEIALLSDDTDTMRWGRILQKWKRYISYDECFNDSRSAS
jgi:hypothetical protein